MPTIDIAQTGPTPHRKKNKLQRQHPSRRQSTTAQPIAPAQKTVGRIQTARRNQHNTATPLRHTGSVPAQSMAHTSDAPSVQPLRSLCGVLRAGFGCFSSYSQPPWHSKSSASCRQTCEAYRAGGCLWLRKSKLCGTTTKCNLRQINGAISHVFASKCSFEKKTTLI